MNITTSLRRFILIQVIRKDPNESVENLIRRFNKKVAQSGVLVVAKKKRYFEKPISKKKQREIAIRKRLYREQKAKEYLGIK